MDEATIGLLHPGEMGAAVGRCLVGGGCVVLWAPDGRSAATAARAEAAGLTGADGGLTELVRRADVVVSICPPHAALDVARQVAGAGFGGAFVDANAISPATAREVAAIVEAGGAGYVDGGIIGPPPTAPGRTRLYLCGAQAGQVRRIFGGTAVDARVVNPGTGTGAASAVKMAYAAWTKGTAALVLAARALARAEGVEEILLAEWAMSQPGLADRSAGAARSAAAKGWRWIAEMEEIASAMAAAGLPGGFHEAAAEIYRRSAHADAAPDAIVDALTGQQGPRRSVR
jgi:3-hydroxyisobutyrate dehydrogenase-like beta-hydroxyacid dehydrogenase